MVLKICFICGSAPKLLGAEIQAIVGNTQNPPEIKFLKANFFYNHGRSVCHIDFKFDKMTPVTIRYK